MKMIDIAKDFTRYPGGRYKKLGPFSGEEFRDDLLVPAINELLSGEKVILKMDGALGYSSSFLEETFGGLVRQEIDVDSVVIIETSKTSLLKEIKEYIQGAKASHH